MGDPDLVIRTGDARLSIRGEPTDAYDVVFGDAFGGLAVPWHLTTVEFLELVRDRLRPGGVYAMNIIDHPPLDFVRAQVATAGTVFSDVALLATGPRLAGGEGGNFMLVASDAPIDVEAVLAGPEIRDDGVQAIIGEELAAFSDGAVVLRDDYAPVDQLITIRP
jgi:spermidine synthase